MLDDRTCQSNVNIDLMLLTRSTGYIKDMDHGDVTLILIGLGDSSIYYLNADWPSDSGPGSRETWARQLIER